MNAMNRPGVAAPCRTFQSRPRTGGDRPHRGTLQIEPPQSRGYATAFQSESGDPKAASRPVSGPQVRLTRTIRPILGCEFTPPRDRARQHQDRHNEPPRRGANPAFQSESGDPKAASRPVSGPQVRLTRTIRPILGCEFTPPRDRARQHQDRHNEPPRRGANPAFQSESGDPKAASRPVSGPQVRLTRTIRPILGCEFTPPRDRAPAPGST